MEAEARGLVQRSTRGVLSGEGERRKQDWPGKTGNRNEPQLIPQNSPARLNPGGQRFVPPGHWVSSAGGEQSLIGGVVSALAKDDSLEKAALELSDTHSGQSIDALA